VGEQSRSIRSFAPKGGITMRALASVSLIIF
jgi:hypothetical protein